MVLYPNKLPESERVCSGICKFHKEWIERTRRSIEEWKKHPPTREEVLEQQKRLDQQRAIRENKQQNNKGQ